jgi:hypothetical protein
LVTTYDRYDIPLMGHLLQGGSDYVFWCVDGVTADVSVWAYAWVGKEELASLDEADDFDAVFAQVTAGKPVVLALYKEGDGVLGSFSVDHPSAFDSLVEAARSQIRGLTRTVGGERAGSSSLR